jgi:copper(I)-binding protein
MLPVRSRDKISCVASRVVPGLAGALMVITCHLSAFAARPGSLKWSARGTLGFAFLVLAPASAAEPVTVSKPWFRYVAPQVPADGYMTLTNHADRPAVLTGAASPACGTLTLHRSEGAGDTGQTVPVPSVTVPAGGTLSFAQGGYHTFSG